MVKWLRLKPSEHDEQSAFFELVRAQAARDEDYECIYAIPNARKASDLSRIWYWREGLKAGVLDVFNANPRGKYHGLYLEFKRPGENLTDKQIRFADLMQRRLYAVHVVYSASEAWSVNNWYMKLRG